MSSHDNLEWTPTHGLASLQIVKELQESVDPLSLSTTLRMEIGGEAKLGTHKLEQLRSKSPHEASVPVTHYGLRRAPIHDNMLEE